MHNMFKSSIGDAFISYYYIVMRKYFARLDAVRNYLLAHFVQVVDTLTHSVQMIGTQRHTTNYYNR